MHMFLFLLRVALVCNICFLLSVIMQFRTFVPAGALASTVIVLGNVVGITLNSLLLLMILGMGLFAGRFRFEVPAWLLATNFVFFVLQIIFLII